jgi:hypothetical protein
MTNRENDASLCYQGSWQDWGGGRGEIIRSRRPRLLAKPCLANRCSVQIIWRISRHQWSNRRKVIFGGFDPHGEQINIQEHALLCSTLVRVARQIGVNRIPREIDARDDPAWQEYERVLNTP